MEDLTIGNTALLLNSPACVQWRQSHKLFLSWWLHTFCLKVKINATSTRFKQQVSVQSHSSPPLFLPLTICIRPAHVFHSSFSFLLVRLFDITRHRCCCWFCPLSFVFFTFILSTKEQRSLTGGIPSVTAWQLSTLWLSRTILYLSSFSSVEDTVNSEGVQTCGGCIEENEAVIWAQTSSEKELINIQSWPPQRSLLFVWHWRIKRIWETTKEKYRKWDKALKPPMEISRRQYKEETAPRACCVPEVVWNWKD